MLLPSNLQKKENSIMVKKLLKKLSAALMLAALFGAVPATAQEGLYIEGDTFVPGGEVGYITIGIENGAYEDYTAFQFDLVLPPGLELAYDEDIPECYVNTRGYLCRSHSLEFAVGDGYIRFICFSGKNTLFSKTTGNLLDIGLTPSPYLKPGDVEIKLTNVKFARVTEEYGYRAEELILTGITAEAESTLPVKVSATNKFSTAVFPFDVDAIPAGLEVYSCNSTSGENLVLTKQSKAAAYTPYILYAENGFDGTLSGAVNASKYSEVVTDGYLCGAVAAQEIGGGNGYYVMQNKGDGPMFYRIDDTEFAIPAGKCWLTIPAGMQSAVSFRLNGTTGIGEVKGENVEVKTVYDLQGRKVENPAKGIYIVNGNKVLVK